MRTFTPKPADINRAWHVIDAEGQVLGKVATEAANLLRGKHKPIYAPHVDTGDHVIVVNAAKLDISPRKLADKQYHRHSGYPGGLSTESLEHLLARDPERVVRLAIRGMLPKNRLGRAQIRKLRLWGFLAWLTWAFVHLWYLIGFRNRLFVFINWVWAYVWSQHGARIVTGRSALRTPAPDPTAVDVRRSNGQGESTATPTMRP